MPRTTLDIDPTVLRELRERARREGKSMGQVASELMAPALNGSADARAAPCKLRSWDMGVPKVDLEDKDAVRRIFDEEDGFLPRRS